MAGKEAGRYGITAGPDEALWFALNQANATGRITTDGEASWCVATRAGRIGRIATDGGITGLPLPDPTARPHAVVAAGTGDCWFTEYDLPSPSSESHGIALGPDGPSGRPWRREGARGCAHD